MMLRSIKTVELYRKDGRPLTPPDINYDWASQNRPLRPAAE